ncbi:hypothetical protein HYPSUDRAFT_40486 [Hypholoma sublateritium FD-334 SS-4]|uniref:Uncharacterized protein n=1 Tax=Hypholoma sublateritium (strain FD-334 SS-4) TaxID=945553 RepID=A0A0D2NVW9_HYPSF|nr:hypothetical protein HYPSUDRAFT_40486 [Hypholoma sublateritium FD-334 SS-4]
MYLSVLSPVLSLVLSVLSLVVFPGLLFVSTTRKNAYILFVISELGITALMGSLWAVASSQAMLNEFDCNSDSNLCNSLVITAQGIQIFICVILLTYMLILFIYALSSHLRHGSGYVWWKTVEELKDFRLPALTHKPRESDGRFMDGSEGRPLASGYSATPLVSPNVPEV